MYTLDPKGEIYEELPGNMLTERADAEIAELIWAALDKLQDEQKQGFHV
jgi:hypothetical protein